MPSTSSLPLAGSAGCEKGIEPDYKNGMQICGEVVKLKLLSCDDLPDYHPAGGEYLVLLLVSPWMFSDGTSHPFTMHRSKNNLLHQAKWPPAGEDLPRPKSVQRGLTASYAEPRSCCIVRPCPSLGCTVGDTPEVEENSKGSTFLL